MWKWIEPKTISAGALAGAVVAVMVGAVVIGLTLYLGATEQNRHDKAMAAEQNRHDKAMAKHDEAMAAEQNRHDEAMSAQADTHEATMTALQALIRNTAPPGPHTSRTGRRSDGTNLAIRPTE